MGKVDDFHRELTQHAKHLPRWHKIDLHNHSPASFDYQGNKATAAEDTAKAILDRDLSVVMFTDHERLPDPVFIEEIRKRTQRLILPGLELNVFVDAFGKPADKVGKNLCFHLLIGFDPDSNRTPDYWAQHVFQQCEQETRQIGSTTVTGVRGSIERITECLSGSGAILIPAHLHTSGGVYRSRSIDSIYDDTEFLRWARSCFTALDVRSDKTAAYFDGTAPETGKLLKTCIRSSDAHCPDELGSTPTWVQMESVNFGELRAALELPHRVARSEPNDPSSYVIGLHVQGAFLSDVWLPLSPHCNVLIGVKGSGKTSALECLRFALGTDVPRDNQPKVNDHLNAILGPAGGVRVLVRRDDGARLIIERNLVDRRFRVTFEDDRELELTAPDAIRFPATILGWHEIEHAATDRQIRTLHLDAIAGREEVQRLTEEATSRALRVRQMHDVAAAKYDEFLRLDETVLKNEQLRQGLQQLEDADLIALRDQLSAGLANRTELENSVTHLKALSLDVDSRLDAVLSLGRFAFQDKSPVNDAVIVANQVFENLGATIRAASEDLSARLPRAVTELESQSSEAARQFQEFSETYSARLGTLPPDVQRLLESHRQILEKTRELPTLRDRLAVARQEVESALEHLRETCEEIAQFLDERTELRRTRVADFNSRLVGNGVQLALLEGAAKEDDYGPTLTQYTATREAFALVRSKYAAQGRFHRMLARAYQDLRDDLSKGDRVMFSRPEFGYLISVLENDDLRIALDVGKPGEPFSPIESLSAGQRCTAIFPIVLGLENGPLVIDQPEDNLDNRHIARTVAQRLLVDKRRRQIVMTSHNANLVVLSDAEQIAVFEAVGGSGFVSVAGFLAHSRSEVTHHVLDILDGGEAALQQRGKKYGLT